MTFKYNRTKVKRYLKKLYFYVENSSLKDALSIVEESFFNVALSHYPNTGVVGSRRENFKRFSNLLTTSELELSPLKDFESVQEGFE